MPCIFIAKMLNLAMFNSPLGTITHHSNDDTTYISVSNFMVIATCQCLASSPEENTI